VNGAAGNFLSPAEKLSPNAFRTGTLSLQIFIFCLISIFLCGILFSE
jgi:hypothetical protein